MTPILCTNTWQRITHGPPRSRSFSYDAKCKDSTAKAMSFLDNAAFQSVQVMIPTKKGRMIFRIGGLLLHCICRHWTEHLLIPRRKSRTGRSIVINGPLSSFHVLASIGSHFPLTSVGLSVLIMIESSQPISFISTVWSMAVNMTSSLHDCCALSLLI